VILPAVKIHETVTCKERVFQHGDWGEESRQRWFAGGRGSDLPLWY